MRLILTSNIIILLFLLSGTAGHAAQNYSTAGTAQLWEQYKTTFIQIDGRVIDRQQKELSHSESQGYGLLLSAACNDRATFDSILRWTNNNLQARKDNLLPWAWGKRHNGEWGIIDYNNATDGDVLVAFALLKGAKRWDAPLYRTQALKIVEAVRLKLSEEFDGRRYLLPAYYGFQKDNALVVNPSYQIFAAYREFALIDDRVFWEKIYSDSRFLLGRSLFGKMKLPADWVVLQKSEIDFWKERAPLFGNEAIRTILYLSWEDKPGFPEGLGKLFAIYEQSGYLPVHVDLIKNEVSTEEATAGFYAIYARAAEKSGQNSLSQKLWAKVLEKQVDEKDQYYSMTLLLLALCYN